MCVSARLDHALTGRNGGGRGHRDRNLSRSIDQHVTVVSNHFGRGLVRMGQGASPDLCVETAL